MKAPIPRHPNGFTLVELLVVMVIIAALASLGIGGGLRALEKAKKTTSMVAARGIESAVNNFFTEYGSMPTTVATDGVADAPPSNTKDDVTLLNVLLGLETGASPLNARGIKFLSVKEGKKIGANEGIDGLIYGDEVNGIPTVKGLYDPWGGPYYVILDTGFDEKVAPVTAAEAAKTLNARRVAVWSNGADGVNGGGKAEDDVKTW